MISNKFQFHYYLPDHAAALPEQGWKVHVSAFYDNYHRILKKVAAYCYLHDIPFKYVTTIQLRHFLGRQCSRLSAGKVITIYPTNSVQFCDIMTDLYKVLHAEHGPYILTDHRYRSARCLYYRYGTITRQQRVVYTANGIALPDANEPIYTNKTHAFNPLIDYGAPRNTDESGYLFSQYSITGAYQFSNFGGIYKGLQKSSGKEVVIKEARSYLGESEKITAINLRKHELTMLTRYAKTGLFPTVLDHFQESENYYLVTQMVPGKTLASLKKEIYLGGIALTNKSAISECKKRILVVTRELQNLFRKAHQIGIYLNDVSLDNFVQQPDGTIRMIDAESVNVIDQPVFAETGTPEYNDQNLESGKLPLVTRDNKRLGYLLIDLVCTANDLLTLDHTGRQTKRVFKAFCTMYRCPTLYQIVCRLEEWGCSDLPISKPRYPLPKVARDLQNISRWQEQNPTVPVSLKKGDMQMDSKALNSLNEQLRANHSLVLSKQDASRMIEMSFWIAHTPNSTLSAVTYRNLLHYLLQRMVESRTLFAGTERYLFMNEDGNYSPYLDCSGAVVLSALKYLQGHQDTEISFLVKKVLPTFDVNFTRYVTYLNGLAGIMELFLCAFDTFHDRCYLDSAVAKGVVLNAFRAASLKSQWLYPGRPITKNANAEIPLIKNVYRHLVEDLKQNERVNEKRTYHEISA
ncbi:hypothetical protein [Schleiferilactobacillus perolens]|jgi:serine/threonine protein kinase|uniref:class III lanthionine synthetase LanKC N-terminal domain-containing protein n=2 Tax=Schleiferilactobacillus perolens TaxID=100468 RepID=UPI002352324B|nr:hypothetical protein [Schleiferilactobacillus perolens]MCI1913435.1 hypothetical protein [Schleiferilactobacillus harbinensis]MCI2170868.1 hypothetical protein [Schleiferilactobacillus perolens]